MGNNDLSSIQESLLGLLETFADICEENNLRYYLWGGSALGAVRHQGFIPWDDDVDIAMPRADFEKLCNADEFTLPDGFAAILSDELLFGAFENRNCRITHGNEEWDKRQPYLSIDIFPLDGVPDGSLKRKQHILHARMLFILIKLKRIRYIQSVEGMKNREQTRPKKEQLLIKYGGVFEFLLHGVSEHNLVERYFKTISKYPFDDCETIGYYSSRYRDKAFFDRALVGNGSDAVFEGRTFRVFEDVKGYLRHIFGDDYMQLPPEEKRERHGSIRVLEDGETA